MRRIYINWTREWEPFDVVVVDAHSELSKKESERMSNRRFSSLFLSLSLHRHFSAFFLFLLLVLVLGPRLFLLLVLRLWLHTQLIVVGRRIEPTRSWRARSIFLVKTRQTVAHRRRSLVECWQLHLFIIKPSLIHVPIANFQSFERSTKKIEESRKSILDQRSVCSGRETCRICSFARSLTWNWEERWRLFLAVYIFSLSLSLSYLFDTELKKGMKHSLRQTYSNKSVVMIRQFCHSMLFT